VAAPIVHRLVRLFADKEAAAPPSLSYPTPPPSGPPALNRQQRQLRRPSVPIHVADSSSGTLTGLAASLNSTVRTLASGEVVQGQQQKTDVAPSTRWTTGLSALSCENLASSASSDDAESPPIVADNQRRRSGGDFGVGTGIGAKFVPAPPPLLRRRPQSAMAFGSGVVDAPDAIDDTAATGGPSDWSAGLDRLLADPTGVKLFAEFLRGEFSEENVAFWLAVERYRAIEDQEALSTEAARIVYDFIGINAPQCVNLDGATVEQLRADILDASRPPPSRHAFDKAQRHIYDLMRMDSYARFLKSSCYREAVAAAAAQRQQRPLTIGAETLDNGGGAKRRGFLASLVRGRTLRRHSDQQQQHGSRSPSPPSASALPTAAGCCRVQLADGSSALLDVRGAAGQQQRSLREALLDLCERRGLNFAAAEVR
uniref:RGS domain-containing protein n=2 Tax=Macrostomum lignano TaxID=282301 RepID=A0A1I8IEF4_9PLAT